MSDRGLVHHVDLTVADPSSSRPFYEFVLGHMGYRCVREDADGYDWDRQGPGPFLSIGVRRAKGAGADRKHDRYSPGLHHLAWTADSRADVDVFHNRLSAFGATILDAPAVYPQYSPHYYAVFFADPDGLKLEYVCTRDPAA